MTWVSGESVCFQITEHLQRIASSSSAISKDLQQYHSPVVPPSPDSAFDATLRDG